MRLGALLAGAIALALLDALLTSRSATTNVGGAETAAVGLLQRFVDPATPAFSSTSTSSSSSSSSNSSSAKSTTVAPGQLGPLGSTPL